MKTLLLITTVLLAQISAAQNIQGKIVYRATPDLEDYLKNAKTDSTLTEIQRAAMIENGEASVPLNFELLFKDNESIFRSEEDMETLRRKGLLMNQTGFLGGYQYLYYTNLDNQEKIYQYFFTKEVLVSTADVEWELTKETKKIGNYQCYKAIADLGTRKIHGMSPQEPIIAWYTPEIPVSFGIQYFQGLPGLTLELSANYDAGQIYFQAIEIVLNGKKEINIKRPKGKKVTEEKYLSLIEKLNSARRRN